MLKKIVVFLVLISMVVAFGFAAGRQQAETTVIDDGRYDRSDWPKVVRIGVLPEEDQAVMMERYKPFLEHFKEVLGVPVELFFGNDFTAMVEAMRFKHIEVSKFGPAAYVMAAERAGAEAFVQGVRDASAPTYKSFIIANKKSGIAKVEETVGKIFAWVDPASGSGYTFPRAMMLGLLNVEDSELDDLFESVIYSGGHDASVRYVINQDVDAAAVSDSQIQRMQAAKFPGIDDVVVIGETQPIPRSPEAYRSDLPASLKQALLDAYTSFNDRGFLEAHNYHDGFVPVTDAAYDVVRDTQRRLGM